MQSQGKTKLALLLRHREKFTLRETIGLPYNYSPLWCVNSKLLVTTKIYKTNFVNFWKTPNFKVLLLHAWPRHHVNLFSLYIQQFCEKNSGASHNVKMGNKSFKSGKIQALHKRKANKNRISQVTDEWTKSENACQQLFTKFCFLIYLKPED